MADTMEAKMTGLRGGKSTKRRWVTQGNSKRDDRDALPTSEQGEEEREGGEGGLRGGRGEVHTHRENTMLPCVRV